jgi:hypothetical protein
MNLHLAVLALGVISAPGLDPDFAQPGALVRVTDAAGTFEGRLLAHDADSLRVVLPGGGSAHAYELAAVTGYEVRTEEGDRSGLGLQLGFVAGAAVGYALVKNCDCYYEAPTWAWVAAHGALGASLGALVGSFFAHDRWEPVPAVTAALPARGPLLSVRVRF